MLSPAPPHHKMRNSSLLQVLYRSSTIRREHPDNWFQVHNDNSVFSKSWVKLLLFPFVLTSMVLSRIENLDFQIWNSLHYAKYTRQLGYVLSDLFMSSNQLLSHSITVEFSKKAQHSRAHYSSSMNDSSGLFVTLTRSLTHCLQENLSHLIFSQCSALY